MLSSRCSLLCGSIQRQGSWPSRPPIFNPEESIAAPVDTESTSDAEPVSRPSTNPNIQPAAGSPEYTNLEVDKLLRRAAGHPISKDTSGFVYVFVAKHDENPVVKIGHTIDVEFRKQTHQRTCAGLDFQSMFHFPASLYYKHVERLVHAELRDLRYSFDCACGTQHREYFAVDPETARHIVERWIRFCEQHPWRFPARSPRTGCPGELREEWLVRLNGFQKQVATCTSRVALGNRPELWDRFVGNRVWNWFWDDAHRAWLALWRHLWWMGPAGLLMGLVVWCLWLGRGGLAWVLMWTLVAVVLYAFLKPRCLTIEYLLGLRSTRPSFQ
ncbi:T5orf172 domain-containing protein [Parachaetomium inaequale]|uniref:T5orf172 domain-containing protein n=1 Tax=Parachaetomium inaequale TaxID=2588326 RepID=A0AAN6PLI9_9PEZI|nr:T5orf172 domain-containing protein [Parachaetomium inaequale]